MLHLVFIVIVIDKVRHNFAAKVLLIGKKRKSSSIQQKKGAASKKFDI